MELADYQELKYFGSWKSCSRDDAHQVSMVDSHNRVIDFDKVKTSYLNNLDKSEECAASVDVLAKDDSGNIYMIEFKNGDFEKKEIRNKVTESLLIYGGITGKTIQDTRKDMIFILVYNPEEKVFNTQERRAIIMARLGKKPCPLYGLGDYEGFYYSKAYLIPKDKFMSTMITKLSV